MPGSKVIRHAQAHRHITSSASVLHDWDEKGNPVPFSLDVLSLESMGIELRPKQAKVIEEPTDSPALEA